MTYDKINNRQTSLGVYLRLISKSFLYIPFFKAIIPSGIRIYVHSREEKEGVKHKKTFNN